MEFDDPEIARARSEAKADLAAQRAPGQVVTRAATMLRMVQQGLRDMQETDHDRILLGFLGVVVFGRSMTLVMQNLRRHDQEAFDRWYAPWQQEMKGDPLIDYFHNLRTSVIHQDAPAIGIVLGFLHGLPLHVTWAIRTTGTKGLDVVAGKRVAWHGSGGTL